MTSAPSLSEPPLLNIECQEWEQARSKGQMACLAAASPGPSGARSPCSAVLQSCLPLLLCSPPQLCRQPLRQVWPHVLACLHQRRHSIKLLGVSLGLPAHFLPHSGLQRRLRRPPVRACPPQPLRLVLLLRPLPAVCMALRVCTKQCYDASCGTLVKADKRRPCLPRPSCMHVDASVAPRLASRRRIARPPC